MFGPFSSKEIFMNLHLTTNNLYIEIGYLIIST